MTDTMTATVRRRVGYAICAVLALATALLLAAPQMSAKAAALPSNKEGVMCEQPEEPGVFNLDAKDGYISTPDGNSIYMWGYTASGRSFQLPGPTLCVGTGDKVTVVLHNYLREDTSIVFNGQDDVRADNRPVQPQSATIAGTDTLTSLVDVAPKYDAVSKMPGTVTYTFTAGAPGTYLYSTGTDVLKQRDMGLYGALIVRPYTDAGGTRVLDRSHDATGSSYAFDPAHEYLYVLSQLDPDLHSAVEANKPFNYAASTARYFFINGRSMPDTLAPNNAAWLPSQPYGALIHITATTWGRQPVPALVRYLNAGPVSYPFHPHGSSQRVIVRDGVPAADAKGGDASYMKFLLDVGPGQSADTLESFTQEYDENSNQIPSDIQMPSFQDQILPGTETWFPENPYLGGAKGQLPNGMTQNNQCGEYYQVAHSHALYQATNYGASFGGMMTLIRIDPTDASKCPAQ